MISQKWALDQEGRGHMISQKLIQLNQSDPIKSNLVKWIKVSGLVHCSKEKKRKKFQGSGNNYHCYFDDLSVLNKIAHFPKF